jgi:hypothetical protein
VLFHFKKSFDLAMSHDAEIDTNDSDPLITCPYSLLGCCLFECSVLYEYEKLEDHLERVKQYIGSTSGGGIVVKKLISTTEKLQKELNHVYESLPVNYNVSSVCNFEPDLTVVVSKTFTGEFKNGERNGHGTERNFDYVYTGEWLNGQRHGNGFWRGNCGVTYEGEWKAGKRHGKGILKNPGVDQYDGEFENDLKHGFGVYMTFDGSNSSYEGIWKDGQLVSSSLSKKRKLMMNKEA